LVFLSLEKTFPGFDQHLPAKCPVFPLLFGAEHYQSLGTASTNVGRWSFSILSSATTWRFDKNFVSINQIAHIAFSRIVAILKYDVILSPDINAVIIALPNKTF
jgi:hypothetical protein